MLNGLEYLYGGVEKPLRRTFPPLDTEPLDMEFELEIYQAERGLRIDSRSRWALYFRCWVFVVKLWWKCGDGGVELFEKLASDR